MGCTRNWPVNLLENPSHEHGIARFLRNKRKVPRHDHEIIDPYPHEHVRPWLAGVQSRAAVRVRSLHAGLIVQVAQTRSRLPLSEVASLI